MTPQNVVSPSVGTSGSSTVVVERVICVVKEDGPNGDGYIVLSLQEDEESQPQGTAPDPQDSPKNPFHLHRTKLSTLPATLSPFLLAATPLHLVPSPSQQVHVFISVRSGTRLALSFWDEVVQPILGTILEPTLHGGKELGYSISISQNGQSVHDFTNEVLKQSATGAKQTVLLLSGDGGIVDFLNGFSPSASRTDTGSSLQNTTVALLPLGTGNALFHSIHKPLYSQSPATPLVQGLRTLVLASTPAPLPIFRATFSHPAYQILPPTEGEEVQRRIPVDHLLGAIVASYGFHATLVAESDTPEYRRHGSKRFGLVAQDLLRESHAYNSTVRVRLSETTDSPLTPLPLSPPDRHTYVLAAQVSNMERTFTISPHSAPLSPALHLIHFGPATGEQTMEIMGAAYRNGEHVRMTDGPVPVGDYEIEELEVTVQEADERWRRFCVDGTIVAVEQGGSMNVRRFGFAPFALLVGKSI